MNKQKRINDLSVIIWWNSIKNNKVIPKSLRHKFWNDLPPETQDLLSNLDKISKLEIDTRFENI